jgi:glycogen synthase
VKILMVSWEYPPVVIGGLGRHVHHLSTALAAAGHEVVVLSRRPTGTDPSTHPSSESSPPRRTRMSSASAPT